MRVAVIGAGISGLAAARTLRAGGCAVTVYERSSHTGGRILTHRDGPFTFDLGATSVAPRGRALEHVVLQELDQTGLTKLTAPIYTHISLRVEPGDAAKNRIERYVYEAGMDQLPIRLQDQLDIRYCDGISQIERSGDGYRVAGEDYDAAVVALPAPEAHLLIEPVNGRQSLGHITYRPCLAVSLGYMTPNPNVPYHALIEPEQRHPLTWLSLESKKCAGRAPEGGCAMVAQMSPEFSRLHMEDVDPSIVQATTQYLVRLYGEEFAQPVVSHVHRWVYSLPENLGMFDSVNHPGSRLMVAGDGLMGGRVELAYESGYQAAKLLLNS